MDLSKASKDETSRFVNCKAFGADEEDGEDQFTELGEDKDELSGNENVMEDC